MKEEYYYHSKKNIEGWELQYVNPQHMNFNQSKPISLNLIHETIDFPLFTRQITTWPLQPLQI